MKYIKWFKEIGIKDVNAVGGKNASLGEMYNNLTPLGVNVPNGFAVTATAYKHYLDYNNLWDKLSDLFKDFNPDDIEELKAVGKAARSMIMDGEIPDDLKDEIFKGYKELKKEYGKDVSLAVRSSATAEDSPTASFAGQNETYLNIKGEENLLLAYKMCLASNFTDRSISYKYTHNFDPLKVYLSVVIMKMVRSDLASSGVMFSIDTESGFRDVVFINAAYGLGENVVQGTINPDAFYVHKPTYKKGYKAVLKRKKGDKELMMVFSEKLERANLAEQFTKNIKTPIEKKMKFAITDEEVLTLANWAMLIEDHYTNVRGTYTPMDMEWAKDGVDGKLYMVQARPETVHSQEKLTDFEIYRLLEKSKVLLTGSAVGEKIGAGRVKILKSMAEADKFNDGDVLVAHTTSPDWEPVMKKASAIITQTGGRTCHAAIVSRELGKPAVVGAKDAMKILKEEEEVTVSCAEGEIGKVYEGILKYKVEKVDISKLPRPKTKIMMNLGNPELAFSLAKLPVDGIGLARMEFIINNYIKAHPMAIKHPEMLSESEKALIDKLSFPYDGDAEDFFVKTLSEGVATIASSVYPKKCIVRMSDFKSNEYANLLGGRHFEPIEDNPMIGFRGAARYTHPAYKEGFELECKAMKRAIKDMGFENIVLMIPFCRRIDEAKRVKNALIQNGLSDVEVYMMCEIPSNVILIDEFLEIYDGISIGTNDLTQLTLGVDRDSEIVAFDYSEMDEAVKRMVKMAVEGAKRNNKYSGLCGQAPSDYPEFAEFLVKIGIESMSLNPDSVLKIIKDIAEMENNSNLKGK
ncbi:phosphoenolpyruvate synthase [Caminibacter mediatlanticus TB-2]|uniref:Phosphoenolpyruvate synthase n=1 Tax=Caminibacter mediatlanticus TB-2 TaxID=391592 RepID=A0ABX5VB00_9BACT|nr:phosphoenolpyruvate synthase [Caminibacter mediatlanticus]QCT94754.1 phosphoenolpyruvate synthase [Caminibacter mediatlanticus TB-2]